MLTHVCKRAGQYVQRMDVVIRIVYIYIYIYVRICICINIAL